VLLCKFHFFDFDFNIISFLNLPYFFQHSVAFNCLIYQITYFFKLRIHRHLVFDLKWKFFPFLQNHLINFCIHTHEIFWNFLYQTLLLISNWIIIVKFRFFILLLNLFLRFLLDILWDRHCLLLTTLLFHDIVVNWLCIFLSGRLLCLLRFLDLSDAREKHFAIGIFFSFSVYLNLFSYMGNLIIYSLRLDAF